MWIEDKKRDKATWDKVFGKSSIFNIAWNYRYSLYRLYWNNCWFWFTSSISSFNNCKKNFFPWKIYNGLWVLTYFLKVYGSDVQIIDCLVENWCITGIFNECSTAAHFVRTPFLPWIHIFQPSHPVKFLWAFCMGLGKRNNVMKRITWIKEQHNYVSW